jgi:HEAT repeat protein
MRQSVTRVWRLDMRYLQVISVAAAAGLLMFGAAGCAVDPMTRLLEQIDSEDLQERKSAVLDLANLDDQRSVLALTEVFEDDEELMDMAAVALVKKGRELKTEDKPDPIIEGIAALANNVHLPERVRARAVWMLGEIGDREAIPALNTAAGAKLGSGHPATFARRQAAEGLDKLGYTDVGRPYEIPMGQLADQKVSVLPQPKDVMLPPEES